MPGLLRGVARTAVIAGTATAVSNRVSRRQAGRWAEQDQQQMQGEYGQQGGYQQGGYGQPEPPPVPAQAPSMDAKLAQLKELGELREHGLLSDVEFEVQKRRILDS